jgi:branched-subunit amino acid transport protein
MNADLVPLALLMALATYPGRAIPLIVPGVDHLAPPIQLYLRLLAPAVLASLAAVSVMVVVNGGRPSFHIGASWLAVLVAIVLVAVRRNLLVGLVAGATAVALMRATGLAG